MNDRKRLLIMLPILAIVAWLAIFGDKEPAGSVATVAPVAERRAAATPGVATGDIVARPPAEVAAAASAPSTARDGLREALSQESPVNLFPSAAPPPPPEAPSGPEEEAPPPQPPFRAIGSMVKNGRLNVFLDKDNQTFIAVPGAVIDGFRVDVVKSNEVELYNLSTKSKQIIPIEGDK